MFETVLGHEEQKNILKNSIQSGNISHAYLFSGPSGIGKATLAKEFAKAILKVDVLESSPDVKIITKREDKKEIVIEQIRKDIIDDLYESPLTGDKKIYIIEEAHLLNLASQNALLKTLEEPPSYVIMILIASQVSVFLPTILSRVNQIGFHGISHAFVNTYLQEHFQVTLPESLLQYVEGSLGQAIRLVQKDNIENYEKIDTLFSLIQKKDTIGALKQTENIKFSENHMLDYLEYLLSTHSLFLCTKFVEKAKIRLKYNGNYDIVIDSMILKIIDHMI